MIRRLYTLVFVRDLENKKILLGYKKRGFGKDKWNGLGGKVEPGETIYDGAKREAKEEAGIDIDDLKYTGYLEFQFESKMSECLVANIFWANKYTGTVTESEEIRPKWFNYDEIPYDNMWKDDKYWFPMLLSNKLFKGYFLFKEDEKTIVNYKLEEVEKLE